MTTEDAINVFKENFCGLDVYCEIHQDGLCLTEECEIWWAIKALEQYKADVQPVRHGKWIPKFNGQFKGGAYWFDCSVCGRIVPDVRNGGWNYCPNCGARMDGERDG